MELPSGTVTFLFTDLEGSTRLWEEYPEAMHAALRRHDDIVRAAISAHGGHVVKTTGDGFHAVFATAPGALAAAVAAQRALVVEPWVSTGPLVVRMGLHTGDANYRDGDYPGPVVNRAARIMSVAHGGQVILSRATEHLVRDSLPDGCALTYLGEHRLRDLGRPEELVQVVCPDLRSEFPRLQTLDNLPTNLPVHVTSFVGRDHELGRVVEALGRERVVTLTGVGGVGKTRLALHAAAEVLPQFRDGVWLCELAAVRDSDRAVQAVAGVLRVTARPGSTLEESLLSYLREQELLLVLDNCEHLLDSVAALADAIEHACPRVAVLSTSREPLAIDGERVLGVRSLPAPEPRASLDAIAHAPAVQLFVARAQSVRDDFTLTSANAPQVAEICARLDGVPLAIELAAARVAAMTPAEIARRLDRRFELLAGGRRRAVERHQTLRATIDWSYDLLSEGERVLLDRLSVFAGGCTLGAAESVCAVAPVHRAEVLDLLANLVARSLVVAEDTGDDTRYRLLETIRQYAEERLGERDETGVVRVAHCDYYAEFVENVATRSEGPEQVEWGRRLARDRDNVLAAMAFALDTRDVERALRLLSRLPLEGFHVNEVVLLDAESVLGLPGAEHHAEAAIAFLWAAMQAWRRSDVARARELLEEAFVIERRFGPLRGSPLRYGAADLRMVLAGEEGDFDQAASYGLDAARDAIDEGRRGLAALMLGGAASHLAHQGPGRGREHAEEAMRLARESGMPFAIVLCLVALAQTYVVDDPERSRALVDEAVELSAASGYENPLQLGAVAFLAGRIGDWPVVLHSVSRVLVHDLRSGQTNVVNLVGLLNLAARALAAHRPEPAAVIQGAVAALARTIPTTRESAPGARPPSVGSLNYVADARREATQIVVASLGETRVRELRARGSAMRREEACAYAREQIDGYLVELETGQAPAD